jgi:HK97 family phage major capsid protein
LTVRSRVEKAFISEAAAHLAGQWLKAILFRDEKAAQICMDKGIIQRAQGESQNPVGGYTVPDALADAIISLRESYGVARRFARQVRMSRDALTVPRVDRDAGVPD